MARTSNFKLDDSPGMRQTCLIFIDRQRLMGKYLLLIAGVMLVYWMVKSKVRRNAQGRGPHAAAGEKMVRCADCGIYLPRGESLTQNDRFYCCAEHRARHDPDR